MLYTLSDHRQTRPCIACPEQAGLLLIRTYSSQTGMPCNEDMSDISPSMYTCSVQSTSSSRPPTRVLQTLTCLPRQELHLRPWFHCLPSRLPPLSPLPLQRLAVWKDAETGKTVICCYCNPSSLLDSVGLVTAACAPTFNRLSDCSPPDTTADGCCPTLLPSSCGRSGDNAPSTTEGSLLL